MIMGKMCGSIVSRIARSACFGPIGEIQPLILPYEILCIAALELQESHTLLVTALCDTRMEVLQDLVRSLELGTPQMQPRPVPRSGEASTESVKRGTPAPILSKDITAKEGSS